MQRYVVHWGEMGSRWGMNRSVAQIHALLFLSSSRSTPTKSARPWHRAFQCQHRTQGTRDMDWACDPRARRPPRFLQRSRIPEVIRAIMEGRKRREIDPTLVALRECAAVAEGPRHAGGGPRTHRRAADFLETVTRWFDAMKRVPRKTLLKMMRMGERIAKIIGDRGRAHGTVTTAPVSCPARSPETAPAARHGLKKVLGVAAWQRLPEAVRERFSEDSPDATYAGA